MSLRPRTRMLVTGYFGRGNVGDDAMLEAFLSYAGRYPHLALRQRALPAARNWNVREVKAFLDDLRWSDVLVLAGGTHFHGTLGWRSTRVLAQFWVMLSLARVTNKVICFAGIGVERPEGRANAWLLRRCLKASALALVRDPESLTEVRRNAPQLRVISGADMAFATTIPMLPASRENKLVVSVLPWEQIRGIGGDRYRQFIDLLAASLDSLAGSERPEKVQILSLYTGNRPNDDDVAQFLATKIKSLPVDLKVAVTPLDAMHEIATSRGILTGRFHALVFAFMTDTPVVVVSHQPKICSLCDVMRLPAARRVTFQAALRDQVVLGRLVSQALIRPNASTADKAEMAASASTHLTRFFEEINELTSRRDRQ